LLREICRGARISFFYEHSDFYDTDFYFYITMHFNKANFLENRIKNITRLTAYFQHLKRLEYSLTHITGCAYFANEMNFSRKVCRLHLKRSQRIKFKNHVFM